MDTMCHHNVPLENYSEEVLAEIREAHDESALREAYTAEELEILGVSA